MAVADPTPGAPPGGAEWHDGFYLRVGLGVGGMVDDFGGAFGFVSAQASGGSTGFSLAVGGSPADGLVIGGAFEADWVVDPAIEDDGVPIDSDVGLGVLTLLGPFIDWYPDPGSGFHVQGMLGGARITVEDQSGARSDHEPVGGGTVIGVGYEWWIGSEVSLGVLARITGATLWDEGIHHDVAAFTVMATFTYH